MCTTRQVIDPTGGLFDKKKARYMDPLGLTKTAVGDPTGHVRKERAAVAAEEAAANYRQPSSVPYRTLLADGSVVTTGTPHAYQAPSTARSTTGRMLQAAVGKAKARQTLLGSGVGGGG